MHVDKVFVKHRMEALGIPTYSYLAEMCDMTRQHLHEILHYKGEQITNAAFGSMWEIAQALECKVDDLIIATPQDRRMSRKAKAASVAGTLAFLCAAGLSWFVSATWWTLDRSAADWLLVLTSSSALWFVVYGVFMRQWFLMTNLATQTTSVLFLLPGRIDLESALWLIGALLSAWIMYSALWTRLNWLNDGDSIHWQPTFAFTHLHQFRTLLPPHFGRLIVGALLGGFLATVLEVSVQSRTVGSVV